MNRIRSWRKIFGIILRIVLAGVSTIVTLGILLVILLGAGNDSGQEKTVGKWNLMNQFDQYAANVTADALAGVLAMHPQILVLDEPTAGLDPEGKREILTLVKKLNREHGITVIMVSHDMNEVYENVNRILVFKDGKVLYDLPPAQLFEMEDEIAQMNLEVPYMAQFVNQLKRNGINLPYDVRTVDQVFAAVVALKEGDVC